MAGFELYEATLWDPDAGYFLLERHLERLAASANRFGFVCDRAEVTRRLAELAEGLPRERRKVRLELSADGGLFVEDVELKPSTAVRVALARDPVDSRDEFLRHKTSRREVYHAALRSRPEVSDVLLWNERAELTELTASNLVLELDGRRVTPHRDSGLLPGTFRAELLARGELAEEVVPVKALERATALFGINSARRWYPLELVAAK
jgi:para-aminobenzoate synthetase/4-amino-4-deoxychorismate lyase